MVIFGLNQRSWVPLPRSRPSRSVVLLFRTRSSNDRVGYGIFHAFVYTPAFAVFLDEQSSGVFTLQCDSDTEVRIPGRSELK